MLGSCIFLMLVACGSSTRAPFRAEIEEYLERFSAVVYPDGEFVRPGPIEVGQYVRYRLQSNNGRAIATYEVIDRALDGWRLRREWVNDRARRVDTFLMADRELGELCRAEGLELLLGQRGAVTRANPVQVTGGVFKGTVTIQTEVKLNGRLRQMMGSYNPAVLLTGLVKGTIDDVEVELLEFGRFRSNITF